MMFTKNQFSKVAQWLLTGQKEDTATTILDNENYEFRMLMKDQLQQLKDKGMPLRISTL